MASTRCVIIGFVVAVLIASSTFAADRPNVLFIGVDDLRPELNCYGATYIKSPNIDRLANEGVLFEQAYCQWAVCMPSRASMLTGLRPDSFRGNARDWRKIVPSTVTLPQHFKNNGYFTQSFGKIYHGSWEKAYVGNSFQDPVSWSSPRFASGPRYYFSDEGVRIARKVFAEGKDKFLRKVKKNANDPDQWTQYFVRGLATEAPDVSDDLPGDGQVAVAALKRLRELHDKPQPFFLAVGFMKPHLPFVAPKRYWDLYDPEKIPPVAVPERPTDAPDFAVKQGAGEVNQYINKSQGLVSPERTRHLRHGYAACVSYVDAQIGRLLDELDTLGIRDNTIIVLWSDHGYKLGDFGAWAKHTNFELDTRVPLIVSAPGLPRGERSQAIVELVDLHPTLSELAGLPVHEGAEGESFAVNVRAPKAPGQDAAFSQFPKGGLMGYTIRTATHRYTEWRDAKRHSRSVVHELYEYGEDRIERVNLAGKPEHSDVQKSLQQKLQAVAPIARPQANVKGDSKHSSQISERSPPNPSERPNILFVVSDDLATRVGCYGDDAAITPNIDRLAAEGICFDRAYVQGTVCTPSRTSFMLGLNNQHARRNHFLTHPETMTMGRWFREHGYQTFSVGKIDHGKHFIDPKAWDIRGEFTDTAFAGLKVIREDTGGPGRRVSRYKVAESAETTRDWRVAQRAMQFFREERDATKPFFAAVGFFKPHQPCVSTVKHFEAHDPQRFTLQSTPADATPVGHAAYVPGIKMTEANQRLAQRAYYASVSHMDEQLGRLLKTLDDADLLDTTLIVFTSDHGYHLGWRGQWAKHDLSEEVMRVPLIVRYPKLVQGGGRTNGIVELLDLFPTFVDVAGLPSPKTLDGKSFVAQLKASEADGKEAAYCDNGARGRTVRTQEWRLIQYPNGKHELYHQPTDPHEYYNVVSQPKNNRIVADLSRLLDAEFGELKRTATK